MNQNVTQQLDNSLIFILILGISSFFLYVVALQNFVGLSHVIMFDLILVLFYFVFGKDVYKSKYKSPKIIGNNINCSYMYTKILDISTIIQNHVAIPLEGYFDKTFGEVTGSGGVLIIDKNHFYSCNNKCIIVKPSVNLRFFNITNRSKFNELIRLFESHSFNTSMLFCSYTEDISLDVGALKVTSFNLSSFLSGLLDEKAKLEADLSKSRQSFEDQLQHHENIATSKKSWKIFKKKSNEGEIHEE